MKMRNSFVSNSSSSSFILITTKENFDKNMKDADKNTKFVVKALSKKVKSFGKNLMILESFDCDEKGWSTFGDIDVLEFISEERKAADDYDDGEEIYEHREEKFSRFCAKVMKDKKNCIVIKNDF